MRVRGAAAGDESGLGEVGFVEEVIRARGLRGSGGVRETWIVS